MKIGQVAYTPWCDALGKVLDDGTVARLDESSFRMTAAEPNLRWLQDNAHGLEVTVEDMSESIAALSLQGPASLAILKELGDVNLKYFRLATATLRGIPVTISRTGYTGDLGFELWTQKDQALPLWDALIKAGTPYGMTPAGMLALDVARIEAGLMLIDVDYVPARKALIDSQASSPYELDLAWTVKLECARAAVRGGRARGAPAGHRLAHQRADLRRSRAGGVCHQRRLVAAAQEIHRARAPARALGGARHAARHRDHRRAPPQARRRASRQEAILRSRAKTGIIQTVIRFSG
jgi:glycine cleavage system aminomethyltransferase T